MISDLAQVWDAPAQSMPIVIIGAGGIVRDAHLPAYWQAALPVAGLIDLDHARATKLAAEWKVPKVYATVAQAAAAHGTDAVYDLAVPPDAITGVLADLPEQAAVLIQKPMGTDQSEARQIRALCRTKQLKAAVNFQLRFAPMMMAVRDAIARGLLGELLEIETYLNIFTPWQMFPFLKPMPRVEISVHSIHYLDLFRAVAGNPRGVFARSMNDPRAADFAQTRTSVILDYAAPLRGIMTINHNHPCGPKLHAATFRFEGTNAALWTKLGVLYDYPNGAPDELWFCAAHGQWEQISLQGNWFVDAFMGPMRNLQRFVAGEDDQLLTSVEDAYQTMALAEACFTALKLPSVPLMLD